MGMGSRDVSQYADEDRAGDCAAATGRSYAASVGLIVIFGKKKTYPTPQHCLYIVASGINTSCINVVITASKEAHYKTTFQEESREEKRNKGLIVDMLT